MKKRFVGNVKEPVKGVSVKKTNKFKWYLAGAIEKARDGGEGYRLKWTPELEKRGYEVIDPVQREKQQLMELYDRNLPPYCKLTNGETIVPKSWADLDGASNPELQKYHNDCMDAIIIYDMAHIVAGEADGLLINWNTATRMGGGTHAEAALAWWLGKPVLTVLTAEIPKWTKREVAMQGPIFKTFEELLAYLDKNPYNKR